MNTKVLIIPVNLFLVISIVFIFASCGGAGEGGGKKEASLKECVAFTDPDGNTYKTVKIGNQCWMAENLKYNTGENSCYDDKAANCETYGRLYTWETAKKACPKGWRLPTDADWEELLTHAGGIEVAGGKLKGTTLWKEPNTNATNSMEFSALPGGGNFSYGSFSFIGETGFWWSATEYDRDSDDAVCWVMGYDEGSVSKSHSGKDRLLSVRCVMDVGN